MTYNFDPDAWFENHRAVLEMRRARGEITDEELDSELEKLERRHQELVERLDGTYAIPSGAGEAR